jgi:CheY-like chemotaxis protein
VSRRVLIVDDDDDVRATISDVFEDLGYLVTTASNGLEALTMLEHGLAPDVVILDLMMPVLDGHAFLERRAASPALRAIPVLVMSAVASRTRALGVASLTKPVNLDELLAMVEQLLETRTPASPGHPAQETERGALRVLSQHEEPLGAPRVRAQPAAPALKRGGEANHRRHRTGSRQGL